MSKAVFMRSSGLALLTALSFVPTAACGQSSASNYTYAARYDLMRRETGTIAPDADGVSPFVYAAVRKTYNAAGLLVKVENGTLSAWQSESIAPANWTGFTVASQVETTYDVMNRKQLELVKAGGVIEGATQYSYTLRGLPECTAVRMNPTLYGSAPASTLSACTLGTAGSDGPDRITRNYYNTDGRLTKVTKAYGITMANGFPANLEEDYQRFEYSNNGKPTAVLDANNNRSETTYDGLDRQTKLTFPSKTTWFTVDENDYEQYGYDAEGNRTSLRKRDGTTLTFAYDALNRQWRKTVPSSAGGASAYSVYSGYDNRGLQTYAKFGSTTGAGIASTFNAFGGQETVSTNMDGTVRTLLYGYDGDGNRTQITGAGTNYAVFYGYDGLDRMTKIWPSSTAYLTVQMDYDSLGRRWHLNYSPSGNGSTVTSSTTYNYDGLGRISSLFHDLAGTANDQTLGFSSYNAASQVTARSSSNDLYAFNRAYNVNRTYYVNGLNQYRDAGGYPFGYDANGNLTDDGLTGYAYDQENRLLSATDKASNTLKATLSYDPLGRLYQVSSGGNTTRFIYDGDHRIEEYDGAGNRLRNYIHGPGQDQPLLSYELPYPPSYSYQQRVFHSDHQGSVTAVVDSSGNPIALNAYDAWGIPNVSNIGKFGYTGQAWLPELGMYYYKARIYSPTLGRFLQTDPIGYNDQMNLYGYVGNDPVNSDDPSGLAQVCTGVTGQLKDACVRVDADNNHKTADRDLSMGQSRKLGNDFHNAIVAMNGRDIGSFGKPITGDAAESDVRMTRVVTQFIGARVSGAAKEEWSKVEGIVASARHYRGEASGYQAALGRNGEDLGHGIVLVGGRIGWVFGGYLYDSPSNLARALLHEMGHTKVGFENGLYSHNLVDTIARQRLNQYGLDGGGCWATSVLSLEGFPGC